jgi:hypothetical protein
MVTVTAVLLALLSVLTAAHPRTQIVTNVATPGPEPSHLATLPGLGRFDAFCVNGKGHVTFRAPSSAQPIAGAGSACVVAVEGVEQRRQR